MGHIFISYSHKDKDYVHKLQKALQNKGFEVWIDDRIDYGTEWPKVIQQHLDECSAFIVVLTDHAYESKWVQNEVARADRKKKPIFPLLLQGDSWLSVEATQYIDVTDKSLPTEKFYKRLAQAVVPQAKQEISSPPLTPHYPKSIFTSRVIFSVIGVFVIAILLVLLGNSRLTGSIQTSTPTLTLVGSTPSTSTPIPIKTLTPTASPTLQIQIEIPIDPPQALNLSINTISIQKPNTILSGNNANLVTLLAKWEIGKIANISPSGEILAVGNKNTVTLFDIYNNKTINHIPVVAGSVSALAFSQDGHMIAIGTDSGVTSGNTEVILWDIQASASLRSFAMKKAAKINSVTFSPNNKRVAIGLGSGRAIDINIDNPSDSLYTINQYNTFNVAYSADGSVLASGGGNWQAERPLDTILLYDVATKKLIKTLDANHGAVYSIDFTADGKTLATGLQDGSIVVWEISEDNYKKLLEFNTFSVSGITSIAFSPDEHIMASGSSNELSLWSASDGSLLKSLTLSSEIETLGFSPDGTFIICGTNDGTVQLLGIQD